MYDDVPEVGGFAMDTIQDDVQIQVAENGYIMRINELVSLSDKMTLPQRRITAKMVSAMSDPEFDIEDVQHMAPLVPSTRIYVAKSIDELMSLLGKHVPRCGEEREKENAEESDNTVPIHQRSPSP